MFIIKTVLVAMAVLLLLSQSVQSKPKKHHESKGTEEVIKEKKVKPKPKPKEWKPFMEREKRQSEDNLYHFKRSAAVFKRSTVSTCTEEFANIANHTMCFTDLPNVVESGVDQTTAEFIVAEHNRYRGKVEPPATDMPALVWNERLAAVAEKWSKQCILQHDKVRLLPEIREGVGQNIAVGYGDWESAMAAWFNEYKHFRYGEDPDVYLKDKPPTVMIGHYTQMVSREAVMVGCGFSNCKDSEYKLYYVCNYLTGQTKDIQIRPYTSGDRCDACRDTCESGVCDCQGKLCKNDGILDLNTCACVCEDPYTGETCSEMNCPPMDEKFCSEWIPDYCAMYSNVPIDCPYMCGDCDEANIEWFESEHGCLFKGGRPTSYECKAMGAGGQDVGHCETEGGTVTCQFCDDYDNVGTDYCPVMCGLCDG